MRGNAVPRRYTVPRAQATAAGPAWFPRPAILGPGAALTKVATEVNVEDNILL
jgi:hypothetical protein